MTERNEKVMAEQGGGRNTFPQQSLQPNMLTRPLSPSYNPASSLPATPTLDPNTLLVRLQYQEQLCAQVIREKRATEEEFGRQRKTFMSQMMGFEQTLEASKNKYQEQIRSLEEKLLRNNEEMVSLQQKAQIRDNKTREAFDVDRVKYEEEIASLKLALEQAMKGQPHLKLNSLKSPSDSLESSMTKAAEESKLLKLVVVPYEEEIDLLKLRLREAQERISLYEGNGGAKGGVYEQKAPPLIDLHSSPERPSLSPSPESTKIQQLQRQLELEKSAHFDIEMHTKELERQRSALQDEVAKLQSERHQLEEKLELQEISYTELKTTWELANQHFIAFEEQSRTKISSLEHQLAESRTKTIEPADCEELTMPRPAIATQQTLQDTDPQNSVTTLSSLYDECMITTDLQQLKDKTTTLHTRYRAEISRLEVELTQTKTACSNYEAQLHRVQSQFRVDLEEKEREVDRLRAEQDKYKAAIMREKNVRAELRRQMEEVKQDMKMKLEQCQNKEKSLNQSLKTLKENFTELKHDTQRDVTKFTDERVKLFEQIETCKEEYRCLKLVQSQNIEGYGQAVAELETAKKEAETNLEIALIEISNSQKICKELEAQLQSQVSQVSSKEDTTRLLSYEKESLQKQLTDLRQSIDSMNKEKEEARISKLNTEEKSKQHIQQQQRQIDELIRQRDNSASQTIQELQKQVNSLKQQLQSMVPSRANNEQPPTGLNGVVP